LIAPVINSLLKLQFATRIASQDYHPRDHISFATSHSAPNNVPFESSVTVSNPAPGREHETKPQQLWPIHCVAGTEGAGIIPEVDSDKIDTYVKKGMDARVEMYSAFADAFGNLDPGVTASSVDTDITAVLRGKNVTDVFVVGLAGDYCVKSTAIDAVKEGLRCWVVEEGTRCVVPGSGWERTRKELEGAGVGIVSADGPEVGRVATL
jgi:nicotinamidase-related amidase